MSRTFKKLSAMVLAMLMVVTMASALAVSAELKYGARTLGNAESQTLGTSANYAKILNNTRSTTDGSFFADSIGLWGWNGITSAAPLSNQNGIDIFVEVVRGTYDSRVWSEPVPESWTWTDYRTTPSTTATVYTAPAGWVTGGPTTQNLNVLDGIDYPNAVTYHPAVAAQVISGSEFTPSVYTKKNIYIDLSAWSNPTSSAKWAKYGTNTITIGFNASANAARVLSWSKMPATGVDSNNLLQFFTFQVDAAPAQIQLFDTDLAAAITATTGDNGVFNVYFQECTKTTFTESTPATPTVYTDDAITAGSFTTAVGYVYNMDGEVALWNDMFHGTHAYTKLFGFEYGVAGLIGYNTKDTTAAVDFMLTAGSLVTYQWDITSASYKDTTTSPATLDLSLLKKSFTAAAGTYAYNYASWLAFVTMRNDAAGYGFTVTTADPRIGTSTLVPSDATVTYTFTGLKGNLRLTWATANAVSGLQTATAVGGEHGGEGGWHGDYRIVGNQSQTLLASELEAGKLLYWEQVPYESGNQPFGTTIQWPTNQNAYLKITYKTGRGTQSDWNFDTKIRALASDMNLVDAAKPGNVDLQLVPTIGGADLIAGLKETDAKGKTLRDFGHTLNYYVEYTNDFMAQMVIDIHDNTLDNLTTAYGKANLVVSIAKGTIVTAYSCPITQYDETFVIPLQDGTFTLMRIKVRTNFDDKVSPLADADITDFNYSRLTFVEQIKLYNDRLVDASGTRVYNSNANKVIYVDMINGIPGSGSYWDYNTATPPVGTFRADGYNGVNYYTKLTALLSYVGFNTDGSKPVRNPVGYAKFYNTIDTALSLTAKQLWDTSFRLVYVKGTGDKQETITEVYYPLTPAQTLKYAAADGNTYVYSLFFHTQYGDMPVAAASMGVAQKSDAKITAMGEYTYAIGTTGKDTGKGFSVGTCTKVEKKGTISIKNYWDNTRGLNNAASGLSNYNKAITLLSVRIPAGATIAVSNTGNAVEAHVVPLAYGTLGVNTVDGLVDAYVAIEYFKINETDSTTFTLTVNYDDGPNDSVKGYNGFSRTWDVVTTWVIRTSADPDTTNGSSKTYNAFTSTLGKTLTPAAAVMPSNPNEAQVKSSEPSVAPTSTPSATSTPAMGNPFNAIAYIITIGASAIGGISTLIIRKRK